MGLHPSRNRTSRSSLVTLVNSVTLTGWPSTGSSLNSSWHAMTWDKADCNPFLWEILLPVHTEGGPKKPQTYWPVQIRQLTKILLYPWFHPVLWSSIPTRERQGEKNRNMTYSLYSCWSMNLDSRGGIYLKECCFYFDAGESQRDSAEMWLNRMGWRGEVSTPSFSRVNWTSTAFREFGKIIISHDFRSYTPQCNRYLVPACILTLGSMVRIPQFVEYAVRHGLYFLSHSRSLSQSQEGLCACSVFNHWGTHTRSFVGQFQKLPFPPTPFSNYINSVIIFLVPKYPSSVGSCHVDSQWFKLCLWICRHRNPSIKHST